MKVTQKMQWLYRQYGKYGEELDIIEALLDDDNCTEDDLLNTESVWDDLYKKYIAVYTELVNLVMSTTSCTMNTAKRMISTEKFDSLMACTII